MTGHSAVSTILRGFLVLFVMTLPTITWADSAESDRAVVRLQSEDALTRLYKASPSAKGAVAHAAGYATFDNFAMKLGVVGGGRGKGLAVASEGGKETFMKVLELQVGLGVGIKKYALIFVFDTVEALDAFTNKGWEFSGQATAAAKHKDKGGAFAGASTVSPGVHLYQLTSSGLAAEISVKSGKYYKDDDLN